MDEKKYLVNARSEFDHNGKYRSIQWVSTIPVYESLIYMNLEWSGSDRRNRYEVIGFQEMSQEIFDNLKELESLGLLHHIGWLKIVNRQNFDWAIQRLKDETKK